MTTCAWYEPEELMYIEFEKDGYTIKRIHSDCPKNLKENIEERRALLEGEETWFEFEDTE